MAAGLYTSPATSITFRPRLLLQLSASLPQKVVLPEPWRPATRTMPGLPFILMSDAVLPMRVTSSSWTIFIIIWSGRTAVSTFCPKALALTSLQKSLATR